MIDRSSVLHGSFAAVAVGLAVLAWLKPISDADASITLVAGTASAIDEVRWSDAEADVSLSQAKGKIAVMLAGKKAISEAKDAKQQPAIAPPREYPGSKAAVELVDKLVPLRASRDLGVAKAEELVAFGLTKPTAKLILRLGGAEHVFDVGGVTFGGSGTYVRAQGGHVYLLSSELFGGFKNGGRNLGERALVITPSERIERVTLTVAGKKRELVQRLAADRAKAYFADAARADTKLLQATAWLTRLLRTRITDVSEDTVSGTPEVTVEVLADNGEKSLVQLWAVVDGKALATATGYTARVALPAPSVESLLREAAAVMDEK